MKRLTVLLILSTFAFVFAACADDEGAAKNNAATSPDNGGSGDAGDTSNNADTDGGVTDGGVADGGVTQCMEGERFNPISGSCEACMTVVYDCDKAVAQLVYDAAADTVTFTLEEGDPAIVAATLGGRTRTGMASEPFTIEGMIDGRVITFDASPFDTAEAYSLNDLSLTDECGETYEVTFVINSEGGRDPFCPLGG